MDYIDHRPFETFKNNLQIKYVHKYKTMSYPAVLNQFRLQNRFLPFNAGRINIQGFADTIEAQIQLGPGGSSTIDDVELYVSALGDDTIGTGSSAAPFATLQRAILQIRKTGWNRTAVINIVSTTPAFTLPTGTICIDPGSVGAQQYPLVIQGGARTAIGSGIVNTAIIDSSTPVTPQSGQGSNLLTVDPITPVVGINHGQILRFTSGTLSAYTAQAESTGTQQVEAFVGGTGINGNPANSITLSWNIFYGTFVFTPVTNPVTPPGPPILFVPSTGDTFVVEALSTIVTLPVGQTVLSTNGALILFYNLSFVSTASAPDLYIRANSTLVFQNTAVMINACAFTSADYSLTTINFNEGSLLASTTYFQTYTPYASLPPPSIFPPIPTLPLSAPCSTAGFMLISGQIQQPPPPGVNPYPTTSTLTFYAPSSSTISPGLSNLPRTAQLSGLFLYGDVELWGSGTINAVFGNTSLLFVLGGRAGPSIISSQDCDCQIFSSWFVNSPATSYYAYGGRLDAIYFHSSQVQSRIQVLNLESGLSPGLIAVNLTNGLIEKYISTAITGNSTVVQYNPNTIGSLQNVSLLGTQIIGVGTKTALLFGGNLLTVVNLTIANCTTAISIGAPAEVTITNLTVTGCVGGGNGIISIGNPSSVSIAGFTANGNSGNVIALSNGAKLNMSNFSIGSITPNTGGYGISVLSGSKFIGAASSSPLSTIIGNTTGCIRVDQSEVILNLNANTILSAPVGSTACIIGTSNSKITINSGQLISNGGPALTLQDSLAYLNGVVVTVNSTTTTGGLVVSLGGSLKMQATTVNNSALVIPAISMTDGSLFINSGTIQGVAGSGDGIKALRSVLNILSTAISANGGNGITLDNSNAQLSSVTTSASVNTGSGLVLNSGSNVTANGASNTLRGSSGTPQLSVLSLPSTYTGHLWSTLTVGGTPGNNYGLANSPNNSWSAGY